MILPQPPDKATLAALLGVPGGAHLSAERGQDAAGRSRVVIAVTPPRPGSRRPDPAEPAGGVPGAGLPAFVV
ncbi:hypothetical protein QOL99_09545 [Deinococcus sp. MIMF12]|uniref:Uncharacterized protein n=1 Tax=Deinococcus rhizophilus TaxID=3049544 RepID=A0ABT7JH66_9DEIO|nr:hypothetical protein [Deinococcus rhizophilus]MDL2344397.1 hypothetical protein [Deinococcus rhizophilus]